MAYSSSNGSQQLDIPKYFLRYLYSSVQGNSLRKFSGSFHFNLTRNSHNPTTATTDLPLILILSVYTDFLTLKFGKIRIFPKKIRQNTDFFCGMPKVFPYTVLIHTEFFPKIQIIFVIYTDFVLDQSGRSAYTQSDYIYHLSGTELSSRESALTTHTTHSTKSF